MKYSITITDMNQDELSDVVSKLNNAENVQLDKSFEDETNLVETPEVTKPVEAVEPVQEVSDGGFDINGLPWDERIHSSNHKKNKDGSWAKRRSVDDETVKQVTNELLGKQTPALPETTQEVEPVQPIEQQPTPMPSQQQQPTTFVSQETPVTTTQEVAPMPVVAQEVPTVETAVVQPQDFNTLIARIQAAITAGSGTEYLNKIVSTLNATFSVNMGAITDIMGNQPMIDYAFKILEQDGK